MSPDRTVLFLCPHNALRSVIAAGLFDQRAGAGLRAASAGTEPDEAVNTRTLVVMQEVGVDVSGFRPQTVTREQIAAAERVISLDCPLAPELATAAAGKLESWPMPDTTGQPVDKVREVRDLIRDRVETLIAELRGGVS